jgi:hypothetical protein
LALLAALVSAVRNDFSQLHYPAVDFVSAPTLHLIVSCPAAFVPSLKILVKFSPWKLGILSVKLQSRCQWTKVIYQNQNIFLNLTQFEIHKNIVIQHLLIMGVVTRATN